MTFSIADNGSPPKKKAQDGKWSQYLHVDGSLPCVQQIILKYEESVKPKKLLNRKFDVSIGD